MKNKHTTGEWSVTEITPKQLIVRLKNYGTLKPNGYRNDNKCGQICEIHGWDGWKSKKTKLSEEDRANAQLIANAPALLEALMDILSEPETTKKTMKRYQPLIDKIIN